MGSCLNHPRSPPSSNRDSHLILSPPCRDAVTAGRLRSRARSGRRELITIFVHEPDTAEDDPPDFIWRMSPERSGALAMQIRRVVRVGARQHSNGHERGVSPAE